MILSGKTRVQAGRNSRKSAFGRSEKNLESRKGNLVMKNAHSGKKEFMSRICTEILKLRFQFSCQLWVI